MRYERDERDRVGLLLAEPGRRGRQKEAAALYGRSPRTMRNWTAKAGTARRSVGRPQRSHEERVEAMRRVEQEAERRQRLPSWRTAHRVLGIPARLAQETVRTFKELRARRAREGEMARRVSVTVHFKDVLWAEDGGQFGRVEGMPLTAEVLRDAATTKTLAVGVGPPATGEDLAALLYGAQEERGTLPLVLSVDNGGPQKSKEVAEYCEQGMVIVLRNLPRTPRHNPFAEKAIGELKQESGLASDTPLKDEAEGVERLQAAWRRLDNDHHRPRHGYKTAAEVDAAMPRWYDQVDRARFYKAARKAIEEAVRACTGARARRLAEREAIFRTLEDFGPISRTRGGEPLSRPEPARLS